MARSLQGPYTAQRTRGASEARRRGWNASSIPSQKPKPKELGFLQKGDGGQGENEAEKNGEEDGCGSGPGPIWFMWFN